MQYHGKNAGALALAFACALAGAAPVSAAQAEPFEALEARIIDDAQVFDAANGNTFRFISFELTPEGSLSFTNLGVHSFVEIEAQESIRINGLIELGRGFGLVIDAPVIVIGEGALIDIFKSRGVTATQSIEPAAGGDISLGSTVSVLKPSLRVGQGGNISLSAGNGIQVTSAVPEADTSSMLLAGLGLLRLLAHRGRRT
jgi:hypothetical protein